MKVLLDENLTPKLVDRLPPHDVQTTVYAGFGGLENGDLLRAAEAAGFEVFLTGDQNLAQQQKEKKLSVKIAVLTLTAHDWKVIRDDLAVIAEAITLAEPGTFKVVECGRFSRKKP